jgi:hypothetical protein
VTYSLARHGAGERKGTLLITTDAEEPSLRTIELSLTAKVQPKLWATPVELELAASGDAEAVAILKIESIVPGLLDRFKEAITNRGNVVVALQGRSVVRRGPVVRRGSPV